MPNNMKMPGFHDQEVASNTEQVSLIFPNMRFTYKFNNFFHPFVGDLIAKLNTDSLPGMLDATWQQTLKTPDPSDPSQAQKVKDDFFNHVYTANPANDKLVEVIHYPKEIDLSTNGSYANYNWELFFHIPLTIAVHLSKTQRFAEAQRWFHYIFDPTCNDTSIPTPQRFWKFLAFRNPGDTTTIDEIVAILSLPGDQNNTKQQELLQGYTAILDKPFQPHVVARMRPLAYQYSVVMKYLDNLIAWGDNLFQQDTLEAINEATQLYVLAANLLGQRPERVPATGRTHPMTFAQLRDKSASSKGLGPIGDALVNMEGQFPFNLLGTSPGASTPGGGGAANSSPLLGIAYTLYFCVPPNDKMLGYWDTVADRLFKIRHCMNIAGIVRPLALFDPPIDPGMLVKAAAAGIDIGSIVNGLNQPVSPVRSLTLIQKALELCNEVRSLGGALLSALEKGDGEHLAVLRQGHEIQIQQMALEVRFLQYKASQEATKSLLTSRATALEHFHFYQRLLGLPADPNAPDTLTLGQTEKPDDPPKLTAENFDEAYNGLVGLYDKALALQKLPGLTIAGDTSPAQQSGASGSGRLYLDTNEDVELNSHLPRARDSRLAADVSDTIASVLTMIPDIHVDMHYWGMGAHAQVFGGIKLADAGKIAAGIARSVAAWEQDQAGMAARTAAHERRADEWLLQYNLAAHELMQIGRQILTSLIAEQIAHHEYLNIQQQIANAQEVDAFLQDKYTNEELYLWMQGEISRLYYEYYRFAFDTARKAERTMKQELMRPEVDAQDFVKFNYWDGGRKGLLSGEALHLDVKRMEMAYHENNKRELELTRHVSLRQLNPLALLSLKTTGSCIVTVPEWLYDRDCPGHYMRRIKSVALSIPAVAGSFTSVNCTLSLLKSSLRKSPIAGPDYARQGSEDDRFVDYIGTVQSIVTSSGSNDAGMFETNLRDERFLTFEGAGAESTWKLDLPKDYRAFDYNTISDVILHIRYTARQGVDPTKVKTALDSLFQAADSPFNFALLFSLKYDFPTEWAAFVSGDAGTSFTATIRKDYFPYFVQGRAITITGLDLYDGQDVANHIAVGSDLDTASQDLNDSQFSLTAGPTEVLAPTAREVFLIIRYTI